MTELDDDEPMGMADRLLMAHEADWASRNAEQLASLRRVSASGTDWAPGLKVAEKYLRDLSARLRRDVEGDR